MNENLSQYIERLPSLFRKFSRPKIVHNKPDGDVDRQRAAIQKDIAMLDRNDASIEQCSMIVCDSALMSDEALIYFLPVLIQRIVNGEIATGDLLAARLQNLKVHLDFEQEKAIHAIIEMIHQMDDELA